MTIEQKLDIAYARVTRAIRRARSAGIEVDGTYDGPMYQLMYAHELGGYERINLRGV